MTDMTLGEWAAFVDRWGEQMLSHRPAPIDRRQYDESNHRVRVTSDDGDSGWLESFDNTQS